jgi:glyceraldehyde-3-phosphate dehydrogenase (NADP+)
MEKRTEIVDILMWEICKSTKDAAMEFDRTMIFIDATIKELRAMMQQSSWETVSGVVARFKRAPIGVMLCLGPFNYPFNETYASMIPALLMVRMFIAFYNSPALHSNDRLFY